MEKNISKISIVKEDHTDITPDELGKIHDAMKDLELACSEYKSVKLSTANFQVYYRNVEKLKKPLLESK